MAIYFRCHKRENQSIINAGVSVSEQLNTEVLGDKVDGRTYFKHIIDKAIENGELYEPELTISPGLVAKTDRFLKRARVIFEAEEG